MKRLVSTAITSAFACILVSTGISSQAQTGLSDPRIKAGYDNAERLWRTDPSMRARDQPNINKGCARGRANKRNGLPGLSKDNGIDLQYALQLENGNKEMAGSMLWAYMKLKSTCPDAF